MTSEAGTTRPGDIIAGKYRVEKIMGEGSMGLVVAARHVDLGELRAIKVMLPEALANAQHVERFLREGRAVARLKNDYVAKVHDLGRLDNGAPYIVMEHLDGMDLRAAIAAQGKLPAAQAVTFVLEACEALAEAHAVGIVHRDLKPANLFLSRGAGGATRVKVLDFGVAKVIDPGGNKQLTAATAALGSPLYMSPEQVRSSRDVDGRCDIWALGVILYESLTGVRPFEATTLVDLCGLIFGHHPPPPSSRSPEVPPALDAIVLRCLEKDRDKRFATIAQLAAALAPFSSLAATGMGQRLSVLQPGADTGVAAPLAGSNPNVLAGSNPNVLAGSNPSALAGSNPNVLAGSNPNVLAGSNPSALATTAAPRKGAAWPLVVIVIALLVAAAAVAAWKLGFVKGRARAHPSATSAPPAASARPPSATKSGAKPTSDVVNPWGSS